jgi:hypothetical protein
MEIGMLWFDNDKKSSIPSKVERAARYYHKKYGVNPNLCYIHPQMVGSGKGGDNKSSKPAESKSLQIGEVLVLINEKILPDHFWIGIGTAEDPLS